MKLFSDIVVPNKDIVDRQQKNVMFTFEPYIFPKYLENAYFSLIEERYLYPDLFFQKTVLTDDLKELIDVTEKRLFERGGVPVILLQTPLGGGKTHSLVTLWYRLRHRDIRLFVYEGEIFHPKTNIIWEEMEKQLTGKVEKCMGYSIPSVETIKEILGKKRAQLLIIDEIIEYLVAAQEVWIGNSFFSSHVLAFIANLIEAVGCVDKTVLLITSIPLHNRNDLFLLNYRENDIDLLTQFDEILAKSYRINHLISKERLANIISTALFQAIDSHESRQIVSRVLTYFQAEDILPQHIAPPEYYDKFLASYPFLPEVIECLYCRWMNVPASMGIRGILKILAAVINRLKDSNLNYITLADFDLNEKAIFDAFQSPLGEAFSGAFYNSIKEVVEDTNLNLIDQMIDVSLNIKYRGLKLGSRCLRTILIYLIAAGDNMRLNITEDHIKRCVSFLSIPSGVISRVLNLLKEKAPSFLKDEVFRTLSNAFSHAEGEMVGAMARFFNAQKDLTKY